MHRLVNILPIHCVRGLKAFNNLTTESTSGAHIRNLDQAKPDLDFAYTPVGWPSGQEATLSLLTLWSQPYRACSSLGGLWVGMGVGVGLIALSPITFPMAVGVAAGRYMYHPPPQLYTEYTRR